MEEIVQSKMEILLVSVENPIQVKKLFNLEFVILRMYNYLQIGRLCELVDPDKVCSHIKCEHGARCNSSLLQSADQSQLQQLLDGKTAVSPCECVGYWEGTFCNECPLCDESNSDCSECK